MQCINCVISAINTIICVSNEVVDRQLSINTLLNQFGHISAALEPWKQKTVSQEVIEIWKQIDVLVQTFLPTSKCSTFPCTTCKLQKNRVGYKQLHHSGLHCMTIHLSQVGMGGYWSRDRKLPHQWRRKFPNLWKEGKNSRYFNRNRTKSRARWKNFNSPLWAHSRAARITETLPVQSKV